MKSYLRYSILFAGIWFVGKMSFFYAQILQDSAGVKFQVLWNILCLLLAMIVGGLMMKRNEVKTESSALGDIKNHMGTGLIYTVCVAGLLYLYYSKIDPGYNERQIAVAEMAIEKSLQDPKQLKEIKKIRPEYGAMTTEEIFQDMRKNPRAMYSANSTMVLSLLGMLVLTTINAIGLTVVFRRLFFRK